MDTDELTRDAYQALIIESGLISEFIRVDIGVASSRYDNEDDYLKAAHRFIKRYQSLRRNISNAGTYLTRWTRKN